MTGDRKAWRPGSSYERPRMGEGTEKELSGWAPLDLRSYHVPDRFAYVRFVESH